MTTLFPVLWNRLRNWVAQFSSFVSRLGAVFQASMVLALTSVVICQRCLPKPISKQCNGYAKRLTLMALLTLAKSSQRPGRVVKRQDRALQSNLGTWSGSSATAMSVSVWGYPQKRWVRTDGRTRVAIAGQ